VTLFVAAFLLVRDEGPGPGAAPPAPAGAPAPPADPDPAGDATAEAAALRERIAALEVEVLRWKNRSREMDAEQARDLADRLAAGGPEEAESARRVFEARGGMAGRVLGRAVLDLKARVAALEAELAAERGRAEGAVREREEAERAVVRAQETLRAGRLYERALLVQASGHLDQAEKEYGEVLAVDAAHAGALHGRGAVRLARKDAAGALEDFTRACSVRPDFAPSHALRGRALMALSRFREAEEAFDRVLALDPGNLEALGEKEEARRKRGE
jgi:tetratricopeptide (TPR) repeat protein